MRFLAALPLLGSQALAATLLTRAMPHLIIPISQDTPDAAAGTQYSGNIQVKGNAHQVFTEISFDVPSNAAQNCSLSFHIATGDKSGPWTLSGTAPFLFNISSLTPTVNKDTDTWNKHPATVDHVAQVEVNNDGSVKVTGGSVPCLKGNVAQFLLQPAGGRDFGLTWYELTDPLHGITYDMYTP